MAGQICGAIRHIEHIHGGVWLFFLQNDSAEDLENVPLYSFFI